MTITTVFDPPLPSDSPATFNTKAFALLGDLNNWSDEANALATEVNADEAALASAVAAAAASANAASTSATAATTNGAAQVALATTQAGIATTQAGVATSKTADAQSYANTASGHAATATTQAGIATAQAAAAAASAAAAAAGSFTSPVVATVNSTSPALTITQDGTGNALEVRDVTGDTTPFVIGNGGAVSVGHTSNPAIPGVGTNFALSGTDNITASAGVARYSADSDRPRFVFFKSRGALGAQGVVSSGDAVGTVSFAGSDGANFVQTALITAEVDGTPGTNDMPGRLVFSTTNDGASSPTEKMRIDSAGLTTIRNSTGLGYGTGSGGTVTQATSKSTAVTLNKPSGQITMHNAALAAGATVAFTVNNSSVANTDTVTVGLVWNVDPASYAISISAVAAGAFQVRVTNISGASQSEVLVIAFNVHKGSNA